MDSTHISHYLRALNVYRSFWLSQSLALFVTLLLIVALTFPALLDPSVFPQHIASLTSFHLSSPCQCSHKRAPLFNTSAAWTIDRVEHTWADDSRLSHDNWFLSVSVCVFVPSVTAHCANLDLLLRVIQTFLGLGGAALWSLLQLRTTKRQLHCKSALHAQSLQFSEIQT